MRRSSIYWNFLGAYLEDGAWTTNCNAYVAGSLHESLGHKRNIWLKEVWTAPTSCTDVPHSADSTLCPNRANAAPRPGGRAAAH